VRRLSLALAALAASLLLAACGGGGGGGSGPKPPQGPPSARHAASDLAASQAAEEMRAHLIAATRLYFNGRFPFALAHMAAAKQEYATMSAAVRRRDRALDREFRAAFGVIAGQIAQHAPAPLVMTRMGLMQGQLLDAAVQDAVSKPALDDPGVAAQVMTRLADQGAREYSIAAREGFTDPGRRAYQDAFGLIARASFISHQIAPSLGPQRNAIVNSLNHAHDIGFPTGILAPRHQPAAQLAADVRRAAAAVTERFGFSA
jgi:hypothetical protein